MTKSVELDPFDRALLALVQRDNLTPARTLAAMKAGVPRVPRASTRAKRASSKGFRM